MTKRRSDDDDEEEKTSEYSVPIFAPVVPPKITSISHEALVKWRSLRREDEAKMRARVRVSGEDFNLVTQPIKESFDDKLLRAFCTLRLGIKVEDATDVMLAAELDRLLGSVKNDDIPDIKALFKRELHMDLRESDVDARVLSYFQRFEEIIEENGLDDCFAGADGQKQKCKRLIASLAPPVLKPEVKAIVQWKNKDAASDVKKLYDVVYQKAKESERHFQQNKRIKRSPASNVDAKPKTPGPKQAQKVFSPGSESVHKPRQVQFAVGQAKSTANKTSSQNNRKNKSAPARTPPSPCPKCQAMHWLNDCTVATEAEKLELRQKLRDAKKNRQARLKRLGELLPPASRTVTINGVLELPCCPDTGSEYTVMTRSQWDLLVAADTEVTTQPLDSPISIFTYDAHSFVAREKTKLHVLIHTAAGPVEPMEAVQCLIVDSKDDEFIFGRDLLGVLGIDVDRQLEQLASRDNDEMRDDPFDLEIDEPPVTSTDPVTDEDVRLAVEKLIDRAVECGYPPNRVDELRLIVFMYDVWRLELRNDPPARVPPLELRLKKGAQPTKCKPRKYPPHIREFLRNFNAQLVEIGFVYENPTSR
ncbi:hypothetical protein PF003_g33854 [Phytophthora fragariae]|nr:hypothetical protein PF003_g33854 [Phytophthora fragariae]